MIEQVGASVGKVAAASVVKWPRARLRTQFARRGAGGVETATIMAQDGIVDEALAVMTGRSDGLSDFVKNYVKSWLSDPPLSMEDADARRFLTDDRVVALVRSGVRRTLLGEDVPAERERARALYAEMFGGDGLYGETILEDAVRFATLTTTASLDASGKVLAGMLGDLGGGLRDVEASVAGLRADLNAPAVDRTVLDDAVHAAVRRLERGRSALGDDLARAADMLGGRLDAGLALASGEAKARAALAISVVHARAERLPDAERWIERATGWGASDVIPERARLLIARGEHDDAMRLLRDREDRLSRGLLLDAICRRDGDAAGIDWFEHHLTPAALTGHALQAIGVRLHGADRHTEAIAALDAADDGQIDENPILLLARARMKVVRTMAPDVARRFWDQEALVPRPNDVRDDEEGAASLEQALADLRRLERETRDLDAPDLALMVDVNATALELLTGSQEQRAAARGRLAQRCRDPNEALVLAPLALAFEIDVDRAGLELQLDQAERLGGLDDAQLHAAFVLAVEDGAPARIAAFVSRHGERLEKLAGEGVVALRVEAMAKSGDVAAARSLLAERRASLDAERVAFLETTLAEVEGADPVAGRLAQYGRTGATSDLEILVEALASKRDPRTGEYLARLWKARRRVADAVRACDALQFAGREDLLDELLAELGDSVRLDPRLGLYLAWATHRQGRLLEAEAELGRLRRDGLDDQNVRRLHVVLAVDTGRWSDLEPHVRAELAACDDRTPAELLDAARIAQALDNGVAIDLARAAVAKAPDDPWVNVGAYSVAVALGAERTEEVGRWLATAVENSTEKGPMFPREVEDAVQWMREASERADAVNALVTSAQVPLFIAMRPMGASQSVLVLDRMRRNGDEADAPCCRCMPETAFLSWTGRRRRSPSTRCPC